jgi:hypothetical protein
MVTRRREDAKGLSASSVPLWLIAFPLLDGLR